jgi:BirA family biotin operon repressor/biotin-[acetyl-CoA-carboxylase] ligase
VYDTVGSTNTVAKEMASDISGDALFIAKRQSGGRGRMGRSFSSDEGGLYLSYLTHPSISADDALLLTVYASVAAAEAIEALSDIKVGIKWVNDIVAGGKKLAGILTEGAFAEDGEHFSYAVIGIGINVCKREFNGELADIATDIETQCGSAPDVAQLAAQIAQGLALFTHASTAEYMEKYRSRSVVTGKRVRVISSSGEYAADAIGFTDRGALVIQKEDGTRAELSTGEISIRFN